MNYEDRIAELETELKQFDYERLKRIEQAQQYNSQVQQELSDIDTAVMTRQGEIIGLRRLIAEEEEATE